MSDALPTSPSTGQSILGTVLLEHMLDGVAVCKMLYDDQGMPVDFEYLQVNSAFEHLTGLHDVVGKRATDVIPQIRETNPEIFEIYGRVSATGTPERFELFLKPLQMWLSISSFSTEKGFFVAIFENISERKNQEKVKESLSTSLDLYRLAVEHATNHIVITDPDGKILFANKGVENITGYSMVEVLGETPRLWGGQMEPEFYTQFWHTIKEDKIPFTGEVRNRRKNGELYWAKATVSPIIHNGVLVGFVGVEEDITLQKNADEKIRERTLELEKMNSMMVGRELKMIELKEALDQANATIRSLQQKAS